MYIQIIFAGDTVLLDRNGSYRVNIEDLADYTEKLSETDIIVESQNSNTTN